MNALHAEWVLRMLNRCECESSWTAGEAKAALREIAEGRAAVVPVEPTERMLEVAYRELYADNSNAPVRFAYRAMLKAALGGPEGRAEGAPPAGRDGDHNPTPDATDGSRKQS